MRFPDTLFYAIATVLLSFVLLTVWLRYANRARLVRYTVPVGFSGRITVRENIPGGTEIAQIGGVYECVIPPGGQLDLRGEDPLLNVWIEARACDTAGHTIPLGDVSVLPPHTRAFWTGMAFGDGLLIDFVGTKEEWDADRMKLTR